MPITKQTQKGGNYYYYCFSFWLVWPPEIEKCNQHARQIIPCLISEKTCCYPQEKSILKSVMLYSFFLTYILQINGLWSVKYPNPQSYWQPFEASYGEKSIVRHRPISQTTVGSADHDAIQLQDMDALHDSHFFPDCNPRLHAACCLALFKNIFWEMSEMTNSSWHTLQEEGESG